MLQAYMDDSGTHDGAPLCVIAGYWGTVHEWRQFERVWKPTLDKYEVPEFHAKVFWGRDDKGERVGPYKGWTDQRRFEFLDRLIDIIGTFTLYPFATGVMSSEWQKLEDGAKRAFNGATDRFPHASTKAIYMPFRAAVMKALTHCRPCTRMNFVLDSDKNKNGWAKVCFDEMKREARARNDAEWASSFGELTFADSIDALPLQAADMLAYEAYKYVQYAKGDKKFPVKDRYARLLRHFR